MTMKEKIARALWNDICPGLAMSQRDFDHYNSAAQAVLEAMLEPNEAMAEKGSVRIFDRKDNYFKGEVILTFQAMIQAAIDEC